MRSETISELAKALAAAQGELKGAVKESDNPFFKSKYADLASVWDAIRGPFTRNGLSFVQAVNFDPSFPEYIFVDTTMLHTSGEYMSGRMGVKPVKNDPQSFGSATTYARRYGLQALSGVAPEDDDGNAASGQGAKVQDKKQEDKAADKPTSAKTSVIPPTPPSQVNPDDIPEPENLSNSVEPVGEPPPKINATHKRVLTGLMKKEGIIAAADQIALFEFGMAGFDSAKQASSFIAQFKNVLSCWVKSKEQN